MKEKNTPITKREFDLMLSMGFLIVQSIEELVSQIEKREDKVGEEYVAGLKVALQFTLEILDKVNEQKKEKHKE